MPLRSGARMPGIILFTVIAVIVLIALVYMHDTRRTGGLRPVDPPESRRRAPEQHPPPDDSLDAVDLEALAGHVRELRRAVEGGLIGRQEAVDSIIRHAGGQIGEGAAEKLLDGVDL